MSAEKLTDEKPAEWRHPTTIDEFELVYHNEYERELESCDSWIKWCESQNPPDTHGMNFHQGLRGALVFNNIKMGQLLSTLKQTAPNQNALLADNDELEKARERDLGLLRNAEHNARTMEKRVKELEAKLERFESLERSPDRVMAHPDFGKGATEPLTQYRGLGQFDKERLEQIAAIEKQNTELKKDKERLEKLASIIWKTRWVSDAHDYHELVCIAAEIRSGNFDTLDAATKEKP